MSQPTPYDPTISFEEEEQNQVAGRSTVRTAALDAELENIATTLTEILSNLSAIQRDDTELRDGIVKLHTLSTEVLALMGSAGFTLHNPIGWLTATAYVAREIVTNGTGTYVCVVAHTSGVFATDLAAGKWCLIYNSANYTAAGISFTPSGTLLSANVQDAIQELDASTIKGTTTRGGLTNVIFPTMGGGWKDIVRSGWLPWSFNQQWGGAPMPFDLVDGVTGNLYRFDAATQYIDAPQLQNVASIAAVTWLAQGFKVSYTGTIAAVWVRLGKVGNPTNNLEMRILPDDGTGTKPTGSTPIANGTATAQSGKLHTGNANGEWVRFVFPTPPTLTAGTQYHITLKSSGAVDAANYWMWYCRPGGTGGAYPHGNFSNADATPTWAAQPNNDFAFIVEPSPAYQILQSGGQFDAKLIFREGTPLNQSAGLVKPLKDFFNSRKGTILIRGKSWTKDKTIFDALYGLDHDRIVLRCNAATGFAQVDLYRQDGTKYTVTGTTDISAAVFNDVAVVYRAIGDGADYLKLYVNGVVQGASLTGQTFTMDENFDKLGHAWLGGGFQVWPAWTQKLDMSVLPSAAGPAWTWTGTGTEGNCMSVSGGRLYQNKNGYGAAQTGYYVRGAAGSSNANGWAIAAKLRDPSDGNVTSDFSLSLDMKDGAKRVLLNLHEYYQEYYNGSLYYFQGDNKSQERVHYIIGKGSDALIFKDGRLVQDLTGLVTNSTATNEVAFGDESANANANADAVYDYVAYYNTAWLPPQFTSGELHEFAYWQDDRNQVLPTLYNSGSQQSVKSYIGVEENWIGPIAQQRIEQMAIISGPTTSSTANSLIPEMEGFVIGSDIKADIGGSFLNTQAVAGDLTVGLAIDTEANSLNTKSAYGAFRPQAASVDFTINSPPMKTRSYFGLHKVNGYWSQFSGANTATALGYRKMTIEAQP